MRGPCTAVTALALGAALACATSRSARAAPAAGGFDVGVLLGGTLVDDENGLGNAADRAAVISSGAIAGVRGGYAFTPRLAGELEGTFSQPGFAAIGARARVFAYRAHGLVYLSQRRVRPFALAGVGGSYLSTGSQLASSDADPEIYWGIGARFAASGAIDVRIDLRHRIVPGRIDTTSDVLEASVGASFTL